MVSAAIQEWEKASAGSAQNILLALHSDLPLARGLGSSAAYRLGAVAATNALAGGPLAEPELLNLVCRLEGHTDNAVPSMVGGLVVSGWVNDHVHFVRYPVPSRYRFVTLVPEKELATAEARSLLPKSTPLENAVFNMQRAIWLTNAIANDRPEELRLVFEDRLHQPQRKKMVPYLDRVIAAAENAGAFGGFLSGAGSSIIAVSDENHALPIKEAMEEALYDHQLKGSCRVLLPDNRGLHRF